MFGNGEERRKEKLVQQAAQNAAREQAAAAKRALERVRAGKGTFANFTPEGWFGCYEGWPFQMVNGAAVRWVDGSPENPDPHVSYARNAVAQHLGSESFVPFLSDYHAVKRARTGLTLGWKYEKRTTLTSWGNLHGVTIGNTGSGKFVSAIAPTCLNYSGALLVIDPKGEAAAVTARARLELHSQIPCIIDPFDVLGANFPAGAQRITYNPLDELRPEVDTFYADASSMADALLISRNDKDPMWRNNAKDLLTGLIMLTCTHEEFRAVRHLPQVRSLLSSPGDEWPVILNMMAASDNEEIRDCGRRMQAIPAKTFGGVVTQCNSDLQFIGDPVMKRCLMSDPNGVFSFSKFLDSAPLSGFSEKEIDAFKDRVPKKAWDYEVWHDMAVERLWSGGYSLYIVLPPHYLDTHAGWLRLLIAAAVNNASRKIRRGLPTLMLVDEAFQLRQFDLIPRAYSLMRGYRFRVWTFWQDIGQIKANYPDTWQSILGNSFQHLLGTQDLETAKYFSELSGMDEKMVNTGSSATESSGYSSGGSSYGTSTSQNVGRVVEPRYRPEQILNMAPSVGLAFTGDGPLSLFNKYYYYKEEACKIADPNPYHR